MIEVVISPEIKVLGVYLAFSVVQSIDNRRGVEELYDRLIPETERAVRERLSLDKLKDELNVRVFRDLCWRLGIDPTKQRPAHEALLRRVLRGDGLPRVNPAVDIGNYASVKYMLPVGLYDVDRIGGRRVVLRFARDGERVRLLGAGERALRSNQIVLAVEDDCSKILHVFPYRDSEETAITLFTKDVLVVVAGVDPIPRDQALRCAQEITELLCTFLGGRRVADPALV